MSRPKLHSAKTIGGSRKEFLDKTKRALQTESWHDKTLVKHEMRLLSLQAPAMRNWHSGDKYRNPGRSLMFRTLSVRIEDI